MRTIALYVENTYAAEEAMRRLEYFKVNNQVSLHTARALAQLELKAEERFIYKGQDLTLDVMMKIEHIVRIIAEEREVPFDDAYASFAGTRTYEALGRPHSLMWAESAEYVADCFFEECQTIARWDHLDPLHTRDN